MSSDTFIRKKQRSGVQILTNLLFPSTGALVCLYVWLSLSAKAQLAGFAWLGIGVLYLAALTRGFRTPSRELSSLETVN